MQEAMHNPEMARMIRDAVAHARDNTVRQADGIAKVPARNFIDPEHFRKERQNLFLRVPLMLAMSCELPKPGDFKTMSVAGVPILIVRGQDGQARTFLNSCTHRGAAVAIEPRGNGKRFTCLYHGWTYDDKGGLFAVASASDFGAVDKSCMGLKSFPTTERAGMVFAILDMEPKVDFDEFLGGFDKYLSYFKLEDWHYHDSRALNSANWKLAYDATIDYYHVPTLHKNTLAAGGGYSNRALYYPFGPHQRLMNPDSRLAPLASRPEEEWTASNVMAGNWSIFPNVTLAAFNSGFADSFGNRRAMLVMQILPGETPGTSTTNQIFLLERAPRNEEDEKIATDAFAALGHIVDAEDNFMGLTQQRALETGLVPYVQYGRNEGGMQTYHAWVERIANMNDQEIASAFRATERAVA